jgi:DNA-directed RNA polymerase specialized sigma24 family protein
LAAEVKRANELTELLTRQLSAFVAQRRAIALVRAMEEMPSAQALDEAGVSMNRVSKLIQRGRALIKVGADV